MRDIRSWLSSLGLDKYHDRFVENEIDLDAARHLDDRDLKELGIPMGPRKKLLAALRELNESLVPLPTTDVREDQARHQAERRQLTVMFCDLVGSTQLSRLLDPEDMRAVLAGFQRTCTDIIRRYDGFVARFMGDGILAYFGYPRAHEDDAERAVHVGLEVTEAIAALTAAPEGGADRSLAVKVSIATGPVVVGDLIGEGMAEERAVVGETPNLAARLQDLARPGTVVVSAATRRLVGSQFDHEDLGRHVIKGFAEPVAAWRVIGPAAAETRFHATRAVALTPLVGRHQDLLSLQGLWQQVGGGAGQAVVLSGEPGIGKSRLAVALEESVGGDAAAVLRFQCAPYHQNSALWPIIRHITNAAGFLAMDDDAERLQKLEAFLGNCSPRLRDALPLIAALLSVSTGDRYPPVDLGPERQKQETAETLYELVAAPAALRPRLLVFEDVHWIDPSTLEFLDLLIGRLPTVPAMILITCRPEFHLPWARLPNVTLLSLSRLNRRQCATLVSQVTGGKALPGEVFSRILGKADGVPLFIEEMTRTVVMSGLLEETSEGYRLTQPLPALAIPDTLQDSLMARLDQVAAMKEVAQTAAAIGREFSHELLIQVSHATEPEIEKGLRLLSASGLLFRRGTPPRATYAFKHALVRDAAYGSLLKSRRQGLHRRIAETLETHFPATAEAEPETLAFHWREAGAADHAVRYWAQAGQRAMEKAATAEAIDHFESALATTPRLPDAAARAPLEISLRLKLATTLRIAERSAEAFAHLDQAQSVASEAGLEPELSRIHHCRGNLFFPLADAERCLREHQKSLEHARQALSPADEAHALGGLGDAYYLNGRMRRAAEHFRRCVAFAREHGLTDIEITNLHMIGWSRIYLNELREAAEDGRDAAAKAEVLRNVRVRMLGLLLVGFVGTDLGDREVEHRLDEALVIARKLGARAFEAEILAHKARRLTAENRRRQALALAEEALSLIRTSGLSFFGPYIMGVWSRLAEDAARRASVLEEAERILGSGCVGHNYFWFYSEAMEGALERSDWAATERYAQALGAYAQREPLPWSTFHVERGLALAAHGRGRRDDALAAKLRSLGEEARAVGMVTALPPIERALTAF